MNFLDLLFPKRCVSCKKIGDYICTGCKKKIIFLEHQICAVCAKPAIFGKTHPRCRKPYGMDGFYASAKFEGPVREAIHGLKYRYLADVAKCLIENLLTPIPDYFPKFDYLVPVPLYEAREKFRGFNQSFVLSKALGRKYGIPVEDKIIKRIRKTKPQVELKGKKRRKNLVNAFKADRTNLKNMCIGLIDDVSTTRSTLNECCKVLKINGAKTVWGIVLAHG